MTKYQAKNDVAVLLILFTRTETLSRTFEVIRRARLRDCFSIRTAPGTKKTGKNLRLPAR